MNPQSLANLSIGGSAAGTGVGMFGDLLKGITSSNMYSYQAGISRMKENIAQQNATFALQAGEQEAFRYGLAARNRMGKIVTAQAAGNIDVNRGSARKVQEGQQYVTDIDMATIRDNAARRAYGYMAEAAIDSASAKGYDMASKNAMIATVFNMGSTALTGATSVASKWMQAKQSGIYTDDDPSYFYGLTG